MRGWARAGAVLALLVGCGDGGAGGAGGDGGGAGGADCASPCRAPTDGGGLPDGASGVDGGGGTDGAGPGDAAGGGDASDACVCPTFDATVDTTDVGPGDPVQTVTVGAPAALAPGLPFLLDLSVQGPVTAELTVTVGGEAHTAMVYRGRGSLLAVAPTSGALAVTVEGAGLAGERTLPVTARPERTIAGTLEGDALVWGADADVRVEGTATVPAGATLTIEAGARVRLAAKARVVVDGVLHAEGTAAEPVLLTRAGAEAWGELDVRGEATLSHTWLVGGGGDASRAFGHSKSEPVVRVEGGTVTMTGGGVADGPGKAFGSTAGTVTLDGVLVTRVDTGGEHKGSAVVVERSHFVEIPDADGVVSDDDNDGIYLSDGGGGPACRVADTTFAVGEDDAIDHNGATVRVERVWIEGFYHEGIAASKGGRIEVVDAVIRGCDQGIEAGYGAPEVIVQGCLLTGNGVGLRWGDSYDWDAAATLTVERTVSAGNTTDARFDDDQQGPAPEGSIAITCSMIGTQPWDAVGGNGAGAPTWSQGGCVDAATVTVDATCGPVGPPWACP